MASNDVEVLDPKVTVEKLKEFVSERVLNRRNFIAALGVAGAAAGTGLVTTPSGEAQQPVGPGGYAQVDVLNLMLNIKYLKATLYSFITQGTDLPPASQVTVASGALLNAPAKITFTNQQITDLFNEMYYDELNQLITLRSLLGTAVAGRQSMNVLGTGLLPAPTAFPTLVTITQSQAVSLSRLLEDLSAQAFVTASIYLTGTNLVFANQALAVDGFHAGAIRLIAIQTGAPYQSTGMAGTTTSSTETNTTFPGSLTTGSNVIYSFLGTVIPVVGNVLVGVGIPQGAGAVITSITNTPSAALTGIITGGNIINTVSSVTGLAAGQPITGTSIPALAYITAVGTNTVTISANATASTTVKPTGIVTALSPVITGVSSLSGVLVGQPISGTGIPPSATITAASGTTITMSIAATVSSVVKPTGVLINGSNTISAVSSTSGLIVGQPITGTGIPAGATIQSTGTNIILMSVNANANSAVTTAYTFSAMTVAGSNVITPTGAFSGVVVGQAVTGAGIPAGTTITVIGAATVTISANATVTSTATPTGIATSGSAVLTSVSSLTGLVTGNPITGPGIPSGTIISSSTGTTITLSAAATASSGSAVTFSSPSTVTMTTTTGPALSSPTTEAVTIPATEAITIGLSQVIIAGNATATGINTISVLLADNMDVAPGDPGTAALAAAGPAAITGISPAIYQGFFNTAGAATNSANNPPGLLFARSFGQVLAVLYNYNPTTSANTTGNSTGGFFPYGVSGPINNANS